MNLEQLSCAMNLYLQRANYAKSRISSEINLHVQFCYTDLHSSSLPACAYLLIVAPKARLGIYIRAATIGRPNSSMGQPGFWLYIVSHTTSTGA